MLGSAVGEFGTIVLNAEDIYDCRIRHVLSTKLEAALGTIVVEEGC